MSPLMMVGERSGLLLPRDHPCQAATPFRLTCQQAPTSQSRVTRTIYYPRVVLWRLTGLQVVWRMARLDSGGSLAESTILLEEYDCTNGTGASASPVPETGSVPNRLGSLLTGLYPVLAAASRDGSITMCVMNMDAQGGHQDILSVRVDHCGAGLPRTTGPAAVTSGVARRTRPSGPLLIGQSRPRSQCGWGPRVA